MTSDNERKEKADGSDIHPTCMVPSNFSVLVAPLPLSDHFKHCADGDRQDNKAS